MATRINTKFVITLTSVLVLLVLGLVFAVTFLKKSAADHVRLAEEAMERADLILASDKMDEDAIKEHNSERQRAAKHFGAAKNKDAGTVGYLYGFIDAHRQVICQNLTTAGNELDSILAGSSSIHDTPGASDEDRLQLYELLHERVRMGLATERQNPIGTMLGMATKRLDVAPDDPIAQKYMAMAVSYMAQSRVDEAEIEEDFEIIRTAIEKNPETPWLQTAFARHHLGNARRIYNASGQTITPEVDAGFSKAFEHVSRAIELSADTPYALIEAAALLSELRASDEEEQAAIVAKQRETVQQLHTMLSDPANRASLYIEELDRAITLIRRMRIAEEGDQAGFNGPDLAIALAETLTEERGEERAAFQILGSLQRDTNRFAEAEKTLEEGLAIDRLRNARAFIRDHQAWLNMSSILADVKCTLAQMESDQDQRDAILKEAKQWIDALAAADTLQPQWRDSRVDLLTGRMFLVMGQPRQAVKFLDEANEAYKGRDAQTLRLLAQTHTQLGNANLVVGFYEDILNVTRRPRPEDLLNLINLYMNPGGDQRLDAAEARLEQYREQVPNDVRAIRLQARLLATKGQIDEAIAFLQEQDLERFSDLRDLMESYRALTGDTDGVIEILRERIADRPEGEPLDVQLATRLLNLLSDKDAKLAEIDRLESDGLNKAIAAVLRRVMSSGVTTMEDELALAEARNTDPAQVALQKFQIYRRWNKLDEGQAYLERAIELDPTDASVIEWRFRIALTELEYDEAEDAINAMLALPVEERTEIALADGMFMRAQLQAVRASTMDPGESRSRAFRLATIAYNNALEQYTHYVDGWVQLGRLHIMQNNFFAAQDSLREALRRQNRNTEALELIASAEIGSGDLVNAMERYARILSIRPNHPNALDQYTALAMQQGVPERAISLREEIRERVPGDFNNRRTLAQLYASTGRFDQALESIRDIIEAEGTTRQNVATLAQIQGLNDTHDRAIKTVTDYLADLGEEAAWQDQVLLAQVYDAADQPGQADAVYAKAIDMENAEGTFFASLAFARAILARGEAEKAAAMFEALLPRFPENEQLAMQTAELYLRLGNYAKAEAIAKNAPASANQARLLVQSAVAQEGKLGVALSRAKEAAEAYPSDFNVRLNLVELLRIEQDRKAEDERDYNEVLRLSKALAAEYADRVEAKVALADVLLRMDRRAQATAELQAALEFAPSHLATNERLYAIWLQEARQTSASDPEGSASKAREALAIASILIESRPNLPRLTRSAAQAAELAGLSAQAVEYYRRTFELTQSAQDLASYAVALLATGQGATARAVLEKPENATLVSESLFMRALRGRALAAAGQQDTAETLFKNLLKQTAEPNEQMMVARQVGAAFAATPERAIAVIEEAFADDMPSDMDMLLASLLITRRQYEQAAERLSKYIENPLPDVPSQFFALMQLALAQQESGQLEKAKTTYELAYEKMNRDKSAIPDSQRLQMLNNMAFLLADQLEGYEDQAIQYAEQAVELFPENGSAMQRALIEDTLGWAYLNAGRTEDAIRVLRGSVERFPLAANQYHLGRAYLASGTENHKNQAVLVLSKAVDRAKADRDATMTAKAEKWYREALGNTQ
jgi:tetratricopeptide (TPR) repeat protein